jgi:hypothetical protein
MRRSPAALFAAAMLMAVSSCVAPSAPPPKPLAADWRDWPLTPGTWTYRQDARGSIALFGTSGADAELTLRCDRAAGQIFVSRRVVAASLPATLTLRTTSLSRSLTMLPTGGTPPYLAVALGVRDPALDAMGFSRGRLVIEGGAMPTLVVPAWPEILRVAEDCRG